MKTVTHTRAALAVALLGTFVAQSAWACKAPATPRAIPDGQRVELAVMLETKRDVERYLQEVAVFAGCEKDALKLQEVVATQKLVMSHFNAEVRAFNNQARAIKTVNR